MQDKLIQYIFLSIFALTAIVTLLGISTILPIPDFYLQGLYYALLLQLIAVVIAAGKLAFGVGSVEHYKWQVMYPSNLRQNFETVYLKDPDFAAFYEKNKNKEQSAIEDNGISKAELRRFIDLLFVIKKASEFAGNSADGEMFLIRQRREGTNYGTAVLTFPNETQPIAFTVTSEPELGASWHLRFRQPDRFVEYEGRINKWRGGDLDVDFTRKQGGDWIGEIHFDGAYVGKFLLSRKLL
jgi:hypothetical protein